MFEDPSTTSAEGVVDGRGALLWTPTEEVERGRASCRLVVDPPEDEYFTAEGMGRGDGLEGNGLVLTGLFNWVS